MHAHVKHILRKESIVLSLILALINCQAVTRVNEQPFIVHLRGSSGGRIRKLSGFEKHHREPDSCNDATRSFVHRVGHADVQSTAERLYRELRTSFGYKRRTLSYSCEDGLACLKTPDFELEIRVEQESEPPNQYRLSTVLTQLHNDAITQDDRFLDCFNHSCDELLVQFPQAIDLDDKIDRIEAIDALAECLDYAPDATSFELKLAKLDLHIAVTETQMTFRQLTYSNLGQLLEHSQKAFDILTEAGFSLRLTER